MKLDQITTNICTSLLRPGQAKRIPLDVTERLFGYCLACPICGRVTFATEINHDPITEVAGVLQSAAVRCANCGRQMAVVDGGIECA